MAGCRVVQLSRVCVEVHICGGYILALGIAAESRVHSGQQSRWMSSLRALRNGCHLHHRGDKRSRNSVSGNVGDKQSGVLVVGEQEIIEISGHRSHGHILCRNVKRSRSREGIGQNGELHAPRKIEFLLNFTQFLVTLQGATCGDIPEAGKQYRKTVRLDVAESGRDCRKWREPQSKSILRG